MRIIQIIMRRCNQWFFCWHKWEKLKHHGLPNEPELSVCNWCGHIAKTIF